MSYSDWISIWSNVITVISTAFGIWGLYISYFKKKYPGKISYIPIETVRIYENIVKAFPEVSVEHNGEPITEELVYHRAAIVNNGMIDISKQMIDEPLTIGLPNGTWKEAKIKNDSYRKNKIFINPLKGIIVKFKLLRINEAVQFESLSTIKNKDDKSFIESIKLHYRISETQNIKVLAAVSNSDLKESKSKLKVSIIMNILMVMGVLLFIAYAYYNNQMSMLIVMPNDKNRYTVAKEDDKYLMESTTSHKSFAIGIRDIDKLKTIRYVIHENNFKETIMMLNRRHVFFPFSLYPVLFLMVIFVQWREKKKLENQLKFTS